MTLTLILRKDKKGRYWLTRSMGEGVRSTPSTTVQVDQAVVDMLTAIVDLSHRDGQMHLWG